MSGEERRGFDYAFRVFGRGKRGLNAEEARPSQSALRASREQREESVALDRKSPPFIPQKARDGAEFAKGAKDGAHSSSFVGRRDRNKRGEKEELAGGGGGDGYA